MNRIAAAYLKMEKQIADRVANGITTEAKVRETGKTLDMSLEEFVRFQELKTLAVANGILTLEEGMTIYNSLGGTPEHFNDQPVHVKAVLTSFFKELLTIAIKQSKMR